MASCRFTTLLFLEKYYKNRVVLLYCCSDWVCGPDAGVSAGWFNVFGSPRISPPPGIHYTGTSSLQSPACSAGPAHPLSVTEESVRPAGLPGPQLRLASIWPDRGKHFSVSEQKQRRTRRRGRSNGEPNSQRNLTDYIFAPAVTETDRRRNSYERRQSWWLCIFVSRR